MARPRKTEAIDIPGLAVEATIRLIAERGDLDVPLTDVARAVGCKAPALYGHFRNKAALLRAVHDAGFARLYRDKLAVAARTRGDAFERLRQGGRAYLRFALDNPVLYRLMSAPPPLLEIGADPLATDAGRQALDFLTESVQACQRDGYLPGADPARYAFTFWAAVHGAALLILQARAPDGRRRRQVADDLVDSVMALVAATRPMPAQEGRALQAR